MKVLVAVDLQNDFINGALGTAEAAAMLPRAERKIRSFEGLVLFTRDTHTEDYLNTREGKALPVPHCIRGSHGWQLAARLLPYASEVIDKPTFGSTALGERLRRPALPHCPTLPIPPALSLQGAALFSPCTIHQRRPPMKELILASSSPRRRELLSIITRRFTVQTSDCDEAIAPGTGPVDAVRELSLRKARAVWAQQPDQRGLAVIGSDTVVYIDGEILGKPHSHGEAAAMISRLAGRSHTVCTGVTVITAEETRTFHETTEVHFYPLTPQEVAWYCSLEEPYDKAGAYGIQAAGALLVQGLTGDYFNVMGLPIAALARTLREMGVTEALSEN